jgi:hypothetical protein
MTSFYEKNKVPFADSTGNPHYVEHVDQSIGPRALAGALPFLTHGFESKPYVTKFNHDLGMDFDDTLTLDYVLDKGWKYPSSFFPSRFQKSVASMLRKKNSMDGEFSIEGLFGGRHCLEVFYQCCMKWRFTTAEWDKAISKVDNLPTDGLSKEILDERANYKTRLQYERRLNIDSFFTPEDWFRALHFAMDGKISEGEMIEAGSPYLQETVRLNIAKKPSNGGDSLHLYPNNDHPREYRY